MRPHGCGERLVNSQHYAVDWRYVSNGHLTNVNITAGTNGLLVDYNAYYNMFTNVIISASSVGVELVGTGIAGGTSALDPNTKGPRLI